MNKSHLIGALCATVFSVLTLPTQAALIGVLPATPGGTDYQAYYDDVADLSWMANANINGQMTWADANTWAANLDIESVTGWRLPETPQPDPSCDGQDGGVSFGLNCTGSEMGNLYYNVLGNAAGGPLKNTGPFSNVQFSRYWSSTEYAPNTDNAWISFFSFGLQSLDVKGNDNFGWAVRAGDVSAIPVPGAVWLFGSGLVGLLGMAMRKKA